MYHGICDCSVCVAYDVNKQTQRGRKTYGAEAPTFNFGHLSELSGEGYGDGV